MKTTLLTDLDRITAAVQAEAVRTPWLDVAEGALRTAQANLAEHARATAKPPEQPAR